jgi:hypothetical protein
MTVVEHEPHSWYLLREGAALFLKVVEPDGAFQLRADEAEQYAAAGRSMGDSMAARITLHPEQYHSRRVTTKVCERINLAIVRWRLGCR